MPSVVLLTVDCLRADHVGCYGYDRPTTPNIDSFASDSTTFEYGYSNCPGTRWAFQSIHTGMQAARFRGLGIPPEYPYVLARKFQEADFATGGFAHNGFVSREYGYDRGFDTYRGIEDLADNVHPVRRLGKRINRFIVSDFVKDRLFSVSDRVLNRFQEWNEGAYRPDVPDSVITDLALEWISSQQAANTEFFAWIHFMDAHTPYGRYDDYLTALRGDAKIEHVIHPGNDGKVTRGKQPDASAIDAYDANIRSVDHQIGRILQAIRSDTVVAITGDHGEEFGLYNEFHTESFYSSMTQIPMIIRANDLAPGRIGAYPVQHLDLPPTLLDAADCAVPDKYEGEILQETDRTTDDPIYFSLAEDRVAVRSGEWKLIQDEDHEALYRTPHGGDDGTPVDNDQKRNELAGLLDAFREDITRNKVGACRGDLDDDDLSPEVQENLEELGYID